MAAQTLTPATALNGFAELVAAQDFDALGELFTPKVRFRALTPKSTYGMFGRDCAVSTYTLWFGYSPTVDLISSEVEPVGDRIRLAYRVRAFDIEENVWCIVEQLAYCRLRDGLISDISIVCSGFLPIE
jgi:hypothetical protein